VGEIIGLLKTAFEKISWLAALSLVGLIVAIARGAGYLASVDTNQVFWVYLASGSCLALLLVLGIGWSFSALATSAKKKWKRWTIERQALENIGTLPPEFMQALAWLYLFNRKRFSDDSGERVLDILCDRGYLRKADSSRDWGLQTFIVRDEIWEWLGKAELEKARQQFDKRVPPWSRGWRV
jgi:hypothetical protein